MRTSAIFLLLFILFGCGTEGVDIEISEINGWFKKNETEITSIIKLFKNDKCLKRVELNSMEFISQNCKTSFSQETKIEEIKNKLSSLGVVLATSHYLSDGNFIISILINRRGIAVSGGGLQINYWERFPDYLNDELECGAIIKLEKNKWYGQILSSEEPCL